MNVVDIPGYLIGSEAERAGTIRRGGRALAATRVTRSILCEWTRRAHELVGLDRHVGPRARGLRP